ncbi:hypothetical protein Fmac_015161 [Flemingia macrophylla]|uniref:Uncharacterized protein n=1 Tax=Flemingia macrophylla TaxID=520843 RepID=A0ABD1MEL3_9FABA
MDLNLVGKLEGSLFLSGISADIRIEMILYICNSVCGYLCEIKGSWPKLMADLKDPLAALLTYIKSATPWSWAKLMADLKAPLAALLAYIKSVTPSTILGQDTSKMARRVRKSAIILGQDTSKKARRDDRDAMVPRFCSISSSCSLNTHAYKDPRPDETPTLPTIAPVSQSVVGKGMYLQKALQSLKLMNLVSFESLIDGWTSFPCHFLSYFVHLSFAPECKGLSVEMLSIEAFSKQSTVLYCLAINSVLVTMFEGRGGGACATSNVEIGVTSIGPATDSEIGSSDSDGGGGRVGSGDSNVVGASNYSILGKGSDGFHGLIWAHHEDPGVLGH